ncbi:unnamed protein product [Cylindrotheca closterium]|uniref:Uncharacterized protein n=1 Tax=Cylindrotheca closterium TaxID=2856 RepID=A0AAD2PUF6_9STRA|nr:unnamed protein product [Cylindrotheca closterium]
MNPFDDVANVELGNPFPDWQFSEVHLRGIEQLPQQPGFEAAGHQNEIVVTDNQIVEAMELLLQPVDALAPNQAFVANNDIVHCIDFLYDDVAL